MQKQRCRGERLFIFREGVFMATKKRSYHTQRDFFLVLFKHKRVIAVVTATLLLAALLACIFLEPVYEASSKLLVQSSSSDTAPEADHELSSTIEVAVALLTSRFIIEKVIQDIGPERLYPGISRPSLFSKLSPGEKAMLRFRDSLTVRRGAIIHILFQHRDPLLAAEAVNKLVERCLEHYRAARRQHEKYAFFKEQLALMEKKLQESQNELGLFRNENNISSIQKQKSLLLLQISDMEVELGKVRAEITQQESLADAAPKRPEVLSEIHNKLAALRSKEKKLNQQITQYRLDLGLLDKAETRLNELERQVKLDEENYLLYAKKTEEARIASAMDEQKLAHFSVLEPALPPIVPVRPQKVLLMLAALLCGPVAGIILALLKEYFTHTFDTVEDIPVILGCGAPAALPELSPPAVSVAAQFLYPEPMIEQCLRLSYALVHSLPEAASRCVLFTGASEKVGTSTALVAFGCALARHGSRVILVDANLRAPLLHRLCSCEDAGGLTDALTAGVPFQDTIKTTAQEGLCVVPAGAVTENPSLLFPHDRCRVFFQYLREHADWVLVDTPPVTLYNDASLLAGSVDGAVLVIRAGTTRWEVAQSAVTWLNQYHLRLLCALLVRHHKYIPEWLYRRL